MSAGASALALLRASPSPDSFLELLVTRAEWVLDDWAIATHLEEEREADQRDGSSTTKQILALSCAGWELSTPERACRDAVS